MSSNFSMTASNKFSTSGIMAKPAGVPGSYTATGNTDFEYGHSLSTASALQFHALRVASPYSEMTPPGWKAKEPQVQPNWSNTGAGTVSAGSIDNTYLVTPLVNGWGKARELSKNEKRKYPHKQAPDLLAYAKGAQPPPVDQQVADMATVRPPYSKTIPLFHGIDPQRAESGFVRGPNIIPGALPPPGSPWDPRANYPTLPADHALRKLAYDQKQFGSVPVSRIVRASSEHAAKDLPAYISESAGLPGGLSLIPKKSVSS